MNVVRSAFNLLRATANVKHPVRYIRETPWKRKYIRRYGYEDPLFSRPDTLPRINDEAHLKRIPKYTPVDNWTEAKAVFGQNDYIDILGDGSIHPVKLLTNQPAWIRGFRGKEFQMLLLKQRHYYYWKWTKPTKYRWLNKRIMYLYKYLNNKTKN